MVNLKFFLVIGFIPLSLYLWPSFLGGDTQYLVVYGTSMLPTITSGSAVIIKKIPTYELDEIIAFKQMEGDTITVHRIIEKLDDGYITKGDNNQAPDDKVSFDRVMGKVVFATPFVGYFAGLLKSPIILTLFIVLIGAISSSNKRRNRNRSKTQQKKGGGSLLLPAFLVNLTYFILTQISISMHIAFDPDAYGALLLNIFEVHAATTLYFVSWCFAILFTRFLADKFDRKPIVRLGQNSGAGANLLVKRNTISILAVAEIFWLLLATIQIIHVMSMVQQLVPGLGPS